LLAELPKLGRLDRKRFAARTALYTRWSGKQHGKRFIGGGQPAFRSMLFMECDDRQLY